MALSRSRTAALVAGAASLTLLLSACNFTNYQADFYGRCSVEDKDSRAPIFDGVFGCQIMVGLNPGSVFAAFGGLRGTSSPITRTGTGTAADPFVVTVSRNMVADSGVEVTEVTRYVDGSNVVDTSFSLSVPPFFPPTVQIPVRFFRYADCTLGGNDIGGSALTPNGAVCTGSGGARLTLSDTSGGAARQAGSADTVLGTVNVNKDLTNTADPGQSDNAVALSWTATLTNTTPATFTSRMTYDGGTGFGS